MSSFQALAEEADYKWPAAAFLPDVLERFDLPELARRLPHPVRVIEPLDATRQPVDATTAERIFGPASELVQVVTGSADGQGIEVIRGLVDAVGGR